MKIEKDKSVHQVTFISIKMWTFFMVDEKVYFKYDNSHGVLIDEFYCNCEERVTFFANDQVIPIKITGMKYIEV